VCRVCTERSVGAYFLYQFDKGGARASTLDSSTGTRGPSTHGTFGSPPPKNTVFHWVLGPNILRGPSAVALSLVLPKPLSSLLVIRRRPPNTTEGGHALVRWIY
jgi:hypothetical protein